MNFGREIFFNHMDWFIRQASVNAAAQRDRDRPAKRWLPCLIQWCGLIDEVWITIAIFKFFYVFGTGAGISSMCHICSSGTYSTTSGITFYKAEYRLVLHGECNGLRALIVTRAASLGACKMCKAVWPNRCTVVRTSPLWGMLNPVLLDFASSIFLNPHLQ